MIGTILVPGLAAGVAGIFTSWLITGSLFHPWQRHTPNTWRHEGPVQYAGASVLGVLAAIGISALCAAAGVHSIAAGLWIAGLCWLAAAAPVLVSSGLFVNLHPLVVAGLMIDWLVLLAMAGGLAGYWNR
jgi:hypothetical protein